jgi:thiol-disulfide isomerase/thioredoxin
MPQNTGNSSALPRIVGLLLIAMTLLAVSFVITPRKAIRGDSPAVGLAAPTFQLTPICLDSDEAKAERSPGVNGVEVALDGSSACDAEPLVFTEHRLSLIHFWGTWCLPCRQELPELSQVYHQMAKDSNIRFVSVSCPGFDDPSLATLEQRTEQFYRSHDIDLPTYADPTRAARGQVLALMRKTSMAYPTTLLVDGDGVIQATWVGVPPGGAETIRRRIELLLQE